VPAASISRSLARNNRAHSPSASSRCRRCAAGAGACGSRLAQPSSQQQVSVSSSAVLIRHSPARASAACRRSISRSIATNCSRIVWRTALTPNSVRDERR
jgi:hypothetical protein